MAGNIDHIVDASHDKDILIFVDITSIPCVVKPWVRSHIRVDEALVSIPERGQGTRRQGQLDDDGTALARGYFGAGRIDAMHVPSREGAGCRAVFDWEALNSKWVAGDGPPGFRLPPMIDNRNS